MDDPNKEKQARIEITGATVGPGSFKEHLLLRDVKEVEIKNHRVTIRFINDAQMSVPTAPLIAWTPEKPTQPGWYWLRASGDPGGESVAHVIKARLEGMEMECLLEHTIKYIPLSEVGMDEKDVRSQVQWAGPIAPPEG